MSRIFISGGTGFLGSNFVKLLYDQGHHFIIFSRDEQKQFRMALDYPDETRVSFVLGCVRDQTSVMDAVGHFKPDIVLHAAAQKHVKIGEHNPMQTVLTNIHGTKHIVRACIANNVKAAAFVSTDKAVNPTTLYGMTKHIAERIWESASKKQDATEFVGVRYGNILNSTGSLIPLYTRIAAESDKPVFPVTDVNMTRFFITASQAIHLITDTILKNTGIDLGYHDKLSKVDVRQVDKRIFNIPELPAARIIDIATIFADRTNGSVKIIGAFESEKLHESMVDGYSSEHWLIPLERVKEILDQEGLLPCAPKI